MSWDRFMPVQMASAKPNFLLTLGSMSLKLEVILLSVQVDV